MAATITRHEVKFDTEDGLWYVTLDGEMVDACDTRAQAVKAAKGYDKDAQDEADEDEATDLRYQIEQHLGDLDLAALRSLADRLGLTPA